MRKTEADALDIVEEGETGPQRVDVDPEPLRCLELAASMGERIGELIDGDEALSCLACDIDLDVGRLAGAVPTLEVDELVDEGASGLGDSLLDGEPY